MQVLEKILEEIESLHNKILKDKFAEQVTEQEIDSLIKAKEIIRSHMDELPKCGKCSRRKWYQKGYQDGKNDNGWIPVEERLPEKTEYYLVQLSRKLPNEDYSDRVVVLYNGEDKEFMCYGNLIIAWQPLPERYKPAEKGVHIE